MASAARKRGVKIDENFFDLSTAASKGYGHEIGQPQVDIQTKPIIRSKPINIFSIRPSPSQPRRVAPTAYRGGDVVEQIERWSADVETAAGRPLPLAELIRGEIELRWADEEGDGFQATAAELPLLRLADLASSIRQDGLTNPITVVKTGDTYVIETGERRWVAFHLLNAYTEGEDYAAIPARRMPELNLWRQASENTARDALNAIARARQIALLLMDMHGWEHFAAIKDFEHEQDFYAQVADAERWRIPYGKSEQLCSACGFENASRIRQYRALLKLPRAQWTLADDQDVPEFELRKWLRMKSVTAVTDLTPARDESSIPGALIRCGKHITLKQFQKLDRMEQLKAIKWMEAQRERMKSWYQSESLESS